MTLKESLSFQLEEQEARNTLVRTCDLLQAEHPLSKMSYTRSVSDFRFYQILEYLHICNEI